MADDWGVSVNWFDSLANRVSEKAGMEAIEKFARENILRNAVQLTPKETGTLARSGMVTTGGLPDTDSTYQQAKAGANMNDTSEVLGSEKAVYVSFNTPYAMREHEDMSEAHKDGQAKYLETPLKESMGRIGDYAVKQIAQALRGGD